MKISASSISHTANQLQQLIQLFKHFLNIQMVRIIFIFNDNANSIYKIWCERVTIITIIYILSMIISLIINQYLSLRLTQSLIYDNNINNNIFLYIWCFSVSKFKPPSLHVCVWLIDQNTFHHIKYEYIVQK